MVAINPYLLHAPQEDIATFKRDHNGEELDSSQVDFNSLRVGALIAYRLVTNEPTGDIVLFVQELFTMPQFRQRRYAPHAMYRLLQAQPQVKAVQLLTTEGSGEEEMYRQKWGMTDTVIVPTEKIRPLKEPISQVKLEASRCALLQSLNRHIHASKDQNTRDSESAKSTPRIMLYASKKQFVLDNMFQFSQANAQYVQHYRGSPRTDANSLPAEDVSYCVLYTAIDDDTDDRELFTQ